MEIINDFDNSYETQDSRGERVAAGKSEASPMVQTEGDADASEDDLPAQETMEGADSIEDPAVEQAEEDGLYQSDERE